MEKINFKSRSGFTLIELLVVIGILAVLAAIAIPSVAGLIDRANVSADDTNTNEMTNAIERFTSEYELVCQDISSGRFKINDLDSAQSRVYNSTGIANRSDIEKLENGDLNGKGISKDTKYPINVTTMRAIVENYTKTSSATFEPKQSDMHFYYSPDCGIVLYDEASVEVRVTDTELIKSLNEQIVSGKDAKGKILDTNTIWYNITIGGNVPPNPIPNPDDPNQSDETILEETLTFENGFAIIPDDNFELGNLTTGTYDFYLDGNRLDAWAIVVPDEGTMLVTEDKTIYAIGEEEDITYFVDNSGVFNNGSTHTIKITASNTVPDYALFIDANGGFYAYLMLINSEFTSGAFKTKVYNGVDDEPIYVHDAALTSEGLYIDSTYGNNSNDLSKAICNVLEDNTKTLTIVIEQDGKEKVITPNIMQLENNKYVFGFTGFPSPN